MIKVGLYGDWKKAARILGVAPVKVRIALDRAVLQEAQFFRTKCVEGFREQAPGGQPFKPLAPTTLALRRFRKFRGTKALLVSGDLRNSIKVTKKQTMLGAEAFVGVHRTSRGRDGRSLINIAEIHEFGSRPIVIPVTDAMRKYLMMVLKKELGVTGGSSTGTFKRGIIIVRIPARPFLQPVIDKYFNKAEAILRFQARVSANLGGVVGIMGGPIPGLGF